MDIGKVEVTGATIHTGRWAADVWNADDEDSGIVEEAVASEVARRCNAHEVLVVALQKLRSDLGEYGCPCCAVDDDPCPMRRTIKEALRAAGVEC